LNACNGNGLNVPLAYCGRLLGERPQQHEFGLEDRGRALRVTRRSHVDSEVPVRNCTSIVHLKGKTVKGKNAPYVAPFYVPYQLDRRQGAKAI
jgi:hypothetical protein